MSPTPVPSSGPETILLVEDDNLVRTIILRILQDHGFVVLEAAGGPEGLLLAQQFSQRIHLLLSDLSMPVMNGMEVAQRLAGIHPETRVLFLSGYNQGILPGEKAPDKAIAFLQKPFKADELLQSVRGVLQSPA
jgi:two-component system cell cycle sensor histidine kinase/response regulator CckA